MQGTKSALSSVSKPGRTVRYAAARLESIVSFATLRKQPEEYERLTAVHRADLITCLASSRSEQVTYDLRLISRPDPSNVSKGEIGMYLVCRVEDVSAKEVADFGRSTINLLHSQFPEYTFQLLPVRAISAILKPFAARHLVSLTRRTSLERLDTLRSGRPNVDFGFINSHAAKAISASHEDALYHVFPFLPSTLSFSVPLQYLLSMQSPACISIRLRPAALTPAEETFLEAQIGRCERYSQVAMGQASEDLSELRPTLRRQAELLQQSQQRMLFGLRDNAGLMTIEIASPDVVPRQLIDLVGSLVTGPAGGPRSTGAEPVQLYFAGGYDVHDSGGDTAHRGAFETGTMMPFTVEHTQPGAERLVHLFDSSEAAAAFRLPPATVEDLPGLNVRAWRTLPLPRALPTEGCALGLNRHRGAETPAYLGSNDRRRHVYVIGQTGTGKTTLLRNMILDDMAKGAGLCVVDPHGDLFEDLIGRIPEERRDDVVLLDPTDGDFPVGLNLLDCESELERYFVAQELVGIFSQLLADEYGQASGQFAGPIFYQQMRMNLLLLMSKPELPGTFVDFCAIFQSTDYWRQWTPTASNDPALKRWVNEVLPRTNYLRIGTDSNTSMGMYIGSKFENLVFDPRLRNIFGQRRSTIDLRQIMDGGKILLVNLAKGSLTEQNSRFLGMVLLAKLVATTLARADRPETDRRLFHLYVDEFQSLATEGFITLLSEARKFGLSLVLANQFLSQVTNQRIIDAVFGNVGSIVSFRLGQSDAQLIEPQFMPDLSRHDLVRLPNWQAYVRTLANGESIPPFNIGTMLPSAAFQNVTRDYVRAHSRATYARARSQVEADLG